MNGWEFMVQQRYDGEWFGVGALAYSREEVREECEALWQDEPGAQLRIVRRPHGDWTVTDQTWTRKAKP